MAPGDVRVHSPRFAAGNVDRNLALVEALRAAAAQSGATVVQAAIAWVLSRDESIIPLVGSRRPPQLADALGALDLRLSPEALAAIEQAMPHGAAAGACYAPPLMAGLDSEKPAARGA